MIALIVVPTGYDSAYEFAKDCDFELVTGENDIDEIAAIISNGVGEDRSSRHIALTIIKMLTQGVP